MVGSYIGELTPVARGGATGPPVARGGGGQAPLLRPWAGPIGRPLGGDRPPFFSRDLVANLKKKNYT